jgi:hypothetical protein
VTEKGFGLWALGFGLPVYALVGLAVLLLSEAGMLAGVEPFSTFHTPMAWTGYILFTDGIIFANRGSSWLTTNRSELWFLATLSIPLWLVFEAYNLVIHNWHYVGLPQNPVARNIGFGWSFATIWPGIFETAELIGLRHSPQQDRKPFFPRRAKNDSRSLFTLMLAGVALLVWPSVWPSPYLAPAVWLGFVLLFDPLNYLLGAESLIGDFDGDGAAPQRGCRARVPCAAAAHGARVGDPAVGARRLVNLAAAGLVCGVLWEFWNYWAGAKWIYTVPYLPRLKIFEMPVPGYFGFPPFAVECFAMYEFVRRLVWHGRTRPIGL